MNVRGKQGYTRRYRKDSRAKTERDIKEQEALCFLVVMQLTEVNFERPGHWLTGCGSAIVDLGRGLTFRR
jgi:hypothetical protein